MPFIADPGPSPTLTAIVRAADVLRPRRKRVWPLLALAAALAGGLARAQEPLPVKVFFRNPAIQAVQMSPGGKRLVFTAEAKGRVGAFVIDLTGADFKVQTAALFTDMDVRHVHWVDDEWLVYDVLDLGEVAGADYSSAPGLFAVRHDGGESRMLVARHTRTFDARGERLSALARHHRLLHVPTAAAAGGGARAGEVIVGRPEFDGSGELLALTPMWIDTRSGETRAMDLAGSPGRAVHWWFSATGQPRAVMTRRDGRDILHWRHLPSDGQPGGWRPVDEAPQDELRVWPAWVGDDDTMYVTHRGGDRGERVLAPFDFSRRRPGPPWVVAPGFDFQGQLLAQADGSRLMGVRVDTDAEQTVWLDPALKALQQRVDAALPGRINQLTCRRCHGEEAVVLVHSWSDRHAGQLLLWRPARGEGATAWKVVSALQPGVDAQRMAVVDFVRIRARDGSDLPVWLTKPAGSKPGDPLPAVVMVHGGPWMRNGHWRWEPMAQFLASRGYLVIEPEFRGSEGYGLKHRMAGDRQWGQAMQDDVTDALRWAQAQKLAGDRACIVGGSYGGYSTLMGLIRDPQAYRCGSAWFAVTDLMLMVDGSWWVADDMSEASRRRVLPERVGHPDRDRTMLLANSPVEQAARITAPVQLIYGSEDLRVPLSHGRRMRRALERAGQPPEWIVYDGEGHGLRKVENRIDMAKKLEAFLARHLKPVP